MSNLRWNLLAAVLIVLLVYLQYRLWFESGGINDVLQLKKTLAMQVEKNEKLKKRNEELLFQVQRLQNSHDTIESRARDELGMVKRGEKFYQVVR